MAEAREDLQALRARFSSTFGREPLRGFFAPGRINFIGEHIDYAGGSVLPAAIDRGITALVSPREDGVLRLRSTSESGGCDLVLSDLPESSGELPFFWCSYCAGIARILSSSRLHGADILFASDLPTGAGLSSSAALEVLTGYVLLSLMGQSPRDDVGCMELARMARQAENAFVGVPCGIMDQFAVAMGKKDCLIHLDTTSLAFEAIPFPSDEAQLVVLNSNRPRRLHESAYGQRLDECQAALRLMQENRPHDSPLPDLALATAADLDVLQAQPLLWRRAKHIVTETQRVEEAVHLLRRVRSSSAGSEDDGRMLQLGSLLNASHDSLRDRYEVSSLELDVLHEESVKHAACFGERMTGAGFGGCGIALIRCGEAAFESFREAVSRRYRERTGLECSIFVVQPSQGVHELW